MVDGYHAGKAPLDTVEEFVQTVRCADFMMGFSERRGSPGRALVDDGDTLFVNYNSDWRGGTYIGGPVSILGGSLNTPGLIVGTDPGGTELLRTESLRAGTTTLTGTLSAPTVVVGTDPGGTESLRAGSARLNAPVLLGSVPQFTMAADPTDDLQVATKQYVDTVSSTPPRVIGVIQPTSNVTSVQFSGLGLSPPVVLRLVMVIRNPTTSRTFIGLRVNGETNSNDWAYQYITAQAATVGGGRITDFSEIAWVSAGFTGTAICTIGVGPTGAVVVNSTSADASASDTPILNIYGTIKNTTISSLSSIEIVGYVANSIGSGSVFCLEYLGP
jgi:hypothetical protein